MCKKVTCRLWGGGQASGSGWVAVILVPLERAGNGGQNGTGYMVAVAVVVEIWCVENRCKN
jgi:hypothetical protein